MRQSNGTFEQASKNIALETRIDPSNELPEFPDLVRGNEKNNILKRNLRITPEGPNPDDISPNTNQSGGSY